jgi:hypothetical protein
MEELHATGKSLVVTPVKWIIDDTMDGEFKKIELSKVIESLGHEVTVLDHIPFCRKEDINFPYDMDDCVIPYTAISVGKHLKGYFGSFFNEEELKFHNYHSKLQLPNDLWVNGDFVITTFADFEYDFQKYVSLFQTDKLFIRPNSGSKLFTGLPIYGKSDLDYQINALRQLSGAMDNSLIMVSKAKQIREEYRFILTGREVVDGSQYSLMGDHIERHFYTSEALALAKKVAGTGKTPTEVCTCDIAKMADGSVKIVEINSFNCAGWYLCDPELVVKKVSEYTRSLYDELYSI